MLAPTPPAPVQSVPVKQKVQHKPVDLTKETDRKKKDKRKQRRREQRKNNKANKVPQNSSYGLRSKEQFQENSEFKKGRFLQCGQVCYESYFNKTRFFIWELWMSPYPRGTSVQNLTPVTGVKSSSLNTKN